MKDIDIKNEYGRFKLRVSAVVIKDNYVLLEKAKKYFSYIFPGGHVELGETSIEALYRETKEELNCNINNYKLICALENIYPIDNITAQEINYFYELDTDIKMKEKEFTLEEIDKGIKKIHEYVWIPIDKIEECEIYPKVLRSLIKDKKYNQITLCDDRNFDKE